MVSDISECLAGLLRNLPEAVPLEEVKFQGLLLFGRELLSKPVQQLSGGDFIDRYLPSVQPFFVEFLDVVVLAKTQVPPAVDSPMVGHLNDPRYCRTLHGIVETGLLEEDEKDILNEVFRFRFISQDAARDIEDRPGVSLEQNRQRLLAPICDLKQEILAGPIDRDAHNYACWREPFAFGIGRNRLRGRNLCVGAADQSCREVGDGFRTHENPSRLVTSCLATGVSRDPYLLPERLA